MKKIVFLILVISICVALGILFLVISQRGEEVQAGAGDNVFGWAWSENIGWISFNNTTGGGGIDYGVNIGPDGVFSGYAWSENIGWITFNEAELAGCPSGVCRAEMDTATGQVSGWARALAYGDGWDGWISLRGTNYGVSVDSDPSSPTYQEFFGWAWGDMVVGWVSFNCANPETGNVCGTSDYKVQTSFSFNQPPNPPSNLSETINPCAWGTSPQVAPGLSVILNWDYSDPEGDPQLGYEIWVDDDAGFSGAKFNHQVEPSGSTSYALDLSQDDEGDWLSTLEWGSAYYWKVRVKDSGSQAWSDFSSTDSFTTPVHAYPYPNFQPFPQRPSVDEIVEFIQDDPAIAEALCFAGGEHLCQDDPNAEYAWDFDYDPDEGLTVDSTYKGNATTTYSEIGSYQVRLRITDNTLPPPDNYCTQQRTVDVQLPLPEWREVAP